MTQKWAARMWAEENIVQLHCGACKVPCRIPKDFYDFFLAEQQVQSLVLQQVHVFRYLHKPYP